MSRTKRVDDRLAARDDLVAAAIEEAFGERCPDFDPICPTCCAWEEYDTKTESATALAARDAKIAEITQKLERATEIIRTADYAIAEYIRYLDGGEMRGSYDGKPERNGLRAARYKTRAFLNSGASQNG